MTEVQPFSFKPRTKLILENLETARDVLRLCLPEGDVTQEVRQFTAWLETELRRRIRKLERWKTEVKEDELLLYHSSLWYVLGKENEGIHMTAYFLQVDVDDQRHLLNDGGVGLFVPKKWQWHDEFREGLYDALPVKLKSMRWPDNEWPLWEYVRMKPGEIQVSVAAYVQKTASIVSDLVDIGDDIDGLLRKLSRRRTRD